MYLVTVQKHNITVGVEQFEKKADADERLAHWVKVYSAVQQPTPSHPLMHALYLNRQQRIALFCSTSTT